MTIRVSTKGSAGRKLTKKVTVITDAPDARQIPLTITGRVFEIYTLSVKSVKLAGTVGDKIQQTVRLVPSRDYPFTVKEVTAKGGEKIRYRLEEVTEESFIQYDVTVENTATDPGVYFDTLYLKTDSDIRPEIKISVVGKIKAAATEAADK